MTPKYKEIPLKRRNPANSQIKAYIEALKLGEKTFHVFFDQSGWTVKRLDQALSKAFENSSAAREFAEKAAKKARSEVIIHNQQGHITERHSYATE